MAVNQNLKDKIAYIKERWDCVRYASQVLGWPIHKDGDRFLSLAPGSTNTTALIVHLNSWYDFKTGWHGDVIDLCAMACHHGDKGAAIRELGEGFSGTWDESKWVSKIQELCNKIEFWHKELRPEDIEYLHSRCINDETIERLKLGYDAITQRLTIPYFKNGYVNYCAGRDRMIPPPKYQTNTGAILTQPGDIGSIDSIFEATHKLPEDIQFTKAYEDYLKLKRSKYQKMMLDGYNENIPWGLHTLAPNFRETLNKALCEEYPDADKTLCVLEGAFDAITFEQKGFICLSPIGGYFNKQATQFVIDTAKHFERGVFICFDSDKPGSTFNLKMAELMYENRIPFKIGRLPEGVKDVSDYFVAGGDLIELVTHAQPGIEALAVSYTNQAAFKKFIYTAARFIDKADLAMLFETLIEQGRFSKTWLKTLLSECVKAPSEEVIVRELTAKYLIKYIEGVGFYVYVKQGYWKALTDNAVKNVIADRLGIFANGGKLNTILTLLKARTTSQEEFNKQFVENFPNGVLNLLTGELHEHSAAYMCSFQHNYKYDPEAKCPKFDKFINEIMNGDKSKIDLLLESAGYILFPDCRLQKCFVYQGEGANGKSVFINVIRKLIGEEACSAVDVNLLASQFDPIRLKDSKVNFMSEITTNIKDAEARLKAISADDMISAAYKGKDACEFYSRSKLIFATNNPIQSSDTSRGFFRRLMFIAFTQTFEGKKANKNLTNELIEELPGIFNRVYEAFKRLWKNQEFTVTEEHKEIMRDFIEMTDPVDAFFQEEAAEYTGTLSSRELYGKYKEWCISAGRIVQSRHKFIRSFKAVVQRNQSHIEFGRQSDGYVIYFDKLPF